MNHAGWAWAGDTPFQYTKLIASHFGGTRNPLAISWPANIKSDKTPLPQFHHVNDIAPIISETFDVGTDLGSSVSLDYFDHRPFAFDGKIENVKVELK